MSGVDPFASARFVPLFEGLVGVPGTTHAHHRMYGVLAAFRGKGQDAECRPKNIRAIGERAGIKDDRTVRKLIADLVALGLIVADRTGNNHGKATRYEFVAQPWMVKATRGVNEPGGEAAPPPPGEAAPPPPGQIAAHSFKPLLKPSEKKGEPELPSGPTAPYPQLSLVGAQKLGKGKQKARQPNPAFDAIKSQLEARRKAEFPGALPQALSPSLVGKLIKHSQGDAARVSRAFEAFLSDPWWIKKGAPFAAFVGKFSDFDAIASKKRQDEFPAHLRVDRERNPFFDEDDPKPTWTELELLSPEERERINAAWEQRNEQYRHRQERVLQQRKFVAEYAHEM